jgi:hypothetical protein
MGFPPVLLLVAAGLVFIGFTLMIAQAVWPSGLGRPGILRTNYSGLALVVLGVLVLLASEALSPPNEYAEQ